MADLKDTGVTEAPVGGVENITPTQAPIAPVKDVGPEILGKVIELGEEGVATKEKQELDEKFKAIKKFRTAADQGKISHTEARTRTQAAIKESINAMPWRADEFRKEASKYFGAYGEGWGLLNASDAEKAASSRAEKLALAFDKQMQQRYNMPIANISQGKKVDAARQTQLELDAKAAKTARDAGLVNKENVLDVMDSTIRPEIANVSVKISNLVNNLKIGGKTVLERRMEGQSDKSIMASLGRDDGVMADMTAEMINMVNAEKLRIGSLYDSILIDAGTKGGFNIGADQSSLRKKALLDGLDTIIKDVSTNMDSKALFRFVERTELANKGSLATFRANNMVYFLAKSTGIVTEDASTKYIIDRSSIHNPKVLSILDDVYNNVQQEDLERWWDKVKTLPKNFDVLSKTNPKIANLAYMKVNSGMPALIANGWDKDALTKEKQQDFFAMGSYMHVFKTSATQPTTIEQFEKNFFDPEYQKMFQSLPKDKQQHVIVPLRQKMLDIMYDDKTGTGVINRISQTSKALTNQEVVWDVKSDGSISVSVPPSKVAGTQLEADRMDDKAPIFLDNVERLNKYITTFSALMPTSFDKQQFANQIVGSLMRANPQSSMKEKPKEDPIVIEVE